MLNSDLNWEAIQAQMLGFSGVGAIVFGVTLFIGVNLAVFLIRAIYQIVDRGS